jgi:antirestriction protein ArdC
MSRSAARARAGRDRTSLYQEITDKIIAELEAGRVPWVQPWGTAAAKASLAMPKNAATQRRYSGVNVLILWGAVIECGFSAQSWLTFRQALGLGRNVRKGDHGTTVVYADRFTPDEERRRAERDGDEPNAIPFLKRFTVFNTDQCENLPPELTSAPAPVPEGLILPHAEALIAASGADFRVGGERAFYSPDHDFIQVPRRHGGQRTAQRQHCLDAFAGSEDVVGRAEADGMAEETAHGPSRRVDRRLAEAAGVEAFGVEPGAMRAGAAAVEIGDGGDHRRPGLGR